ncbi:hypothetical protein RUM44_011139 [Polyplax serrata]|uniref:Uncharacterized protein n=1 Tax=Polyplax serrata TaxID=468196 RepID=A0ABR1AP67_POLSC
MYSDGGERRQQQQQQQQQQHEKDERKGPDINGSPGVGRVPDWCCRCSGVKGVESRILADTETESNGKMAVEESKKKKGKKKPLLVAA